MAYMIETFDNKISGQIREAPVGFSWTNLFFGAFVPLFRGDWKWAIIQYLLVLPTFGLSCLIFPFIYNSLYTKDLIKNGFEIKKEI